MDCYTTTNPPSYDDLSGSQRQQQLPKRLLKYQEKPPNCIACQFGTAHRRPWRVKGKKSGSIRKENEVEPGDGTSIDQIVSAQPGLIPQMSGFRTNERLWGTTTYYIRGSC